MTLFYIGLWIFILMFVFVYIERVVLFVDGFLEGDIVFEISVELDWSVSLYVRTFFYWVWSASFVRWRSFGLVLWFGFLCGWGLFAFIFFWFWKYVRIKVIWIFVSRIEYLWIIRYVVLFSVLVLWMFKERCYFWVYLEDVVSLFVRSGRRMCI